MPCMRIVACCMTSCADVANNLLLAKHLQQPFASSDDQIIGLSDGLKQEQTHKLHLRLCIYVGQRQGVLVGVISGRGGLQAPGRGGGGPPLQGLSFCCVTICTPAGHSCDSILCCYPEPQLNLKAQKDLCIISIARARQRTVQGNGRAGLIWATMRPK